MTRHSGRDAKGFWEACHLTARRDATGGEPVTVVHLAFFSDGVGSLVVTTPTSDQTPKTWSMRKAAKRFGSSKSSIGCHVKGAKGERKAGLFTSSRPSSHMMLILNSIRSGTKLNNGGYLHF